MTNIAELKDNRIILNAYRKLLRACKPNINKDSQKLIRKAFLFATDAHKEMRRKSGEPYIIHPIEVATICAREIGLGPKSIVSALLHDVVEDTPITLEDIEREFGSKIANIIDGLTKVSGLVGKSSSEQAENFKKIILTLSDDVRVILVKLADRLHNMRTLEALPEHKQLKVSSETLFLFAPLAHRLGLYAIKSELEDLALKYTEPQAYEQISSKLRSSKSQRGRIIRKFITPIEDRLNSSNLDFTIKGRLKSIYSIYNKMQRQAVSFENVYDIFAIRIIVKSSISHQLEKADCWRVYSIVTDIYKPNPSRLRDWISTPKFNGYESLHTTVMGPGGRWVEVQIRTERMDEVAEKGFAAHWKYKEGKESDKELGLDSWLAKIRETISNSDLDSLDFLDDFKLNLFSEEVFAFTPKGELRTLPSGATALDFAFDIHSDVGARCMGAKVNQRIVPLSYKLKNGDQVEIITSKKQKPSEGWLDFVVSAKAKSKIKSALKEEKRKVAMEGKEHLKERYKKSQIKAVFDNHLLNLLTQHFKCNSNMELYYQVGTNKIDKVSLTRALKKADEMVNQEKDQKRRRPKKLKPTENGKKSSKSQDVLVVGDTDIGMEYKFARCCNPIPGDDIFGFITVSDGIKIHRTNCPNGISLMSRYGYRIISAQWSVPEIKTLSLYPAGIRVKGIDSPGIISSVTDIITKELKVNMKSISFEAVDGAYEGTIIVETYDKERLQNMMKKLESITGMSTVSRFEVDAELK